MTRSMVIRGSAFHKLMKPALATLLLTVAGVASADLPFTFSDNTPAKAAEVNANFDHLDQRIDVFEDTAMPVINVDCSANVAALQEAIDARPHGRQTINFEGQCGAIRIRGMHDVILQGVSGGAGPATIENAAIGPHAVSIYDSTGVFINDAIIVGSAGLDTIRIYYSRVVLDNIDVSGSQNRANLYISRHSDVVFQDVTVGDGDMDLNAIWAFDNSSLEFRGFNDLRGNGGYSLWVVNQSTVSQTNTAGVFLASEGAFALTDSSATLIAGELTNPGGFSNFTLSTFNSRLTVQTSTESGFSVEGDMGFTSSNVSFNGTTSEVYLDSGEIDVSDSRLFATANVAIYSTPFKTFRSEVSLGLDTVPDPSAIDWEFGDFTHFGIATTDIFYPASCGEVVIAKRTLGGEIRFCPVP